MPPKKKRSSGKKKGRARCRSTAASNCGQCAHPISKANAIECECTTIVFCSESCRNTALASTHVCPGPPEQTINLQEKLTQVRSKYKSTLDNPTTNELFKEEYRQTVSAPMQALMIEEALAKRRNIPDMTVEHYAKYAEQGHTWAAYMAGIQYKNRLLGTMSFDHQDQATVSNNTNQPGILTTDEWAFRYLSQAAEAGHGLSMQSLADLYEHGKGVQKDIRISMEWLWRATLQSSAGASEILNSKVLTPLEMKAQMTMIGDAQGRLSYGQGFGLSGPNVTSLLLVLLPHLASLDFIVPGFAATTPLCAVGIARRAATGPVKLVGSDRLKHIFVMCQVLERKGNSVICSYGRRGTAKQATVQTYSDAFREIDTPHFFVPPAPTCNEIPSLDTVTRWVSGALSGGSGEIRVHCTHSNTESGTTPEPRAMCHECIKEALERLSAASFGSVVLSQHEALESRGQRAIWRTPEGKIKSETFKNYSRPDLDCVLAAIVACRHNYDVQLASPLFVAQDPNMFWPVIHSHGSVRAAFEYVAPHVDWDKELGPIVPPVEQISVVNADETLEPGSVLRKCGNDLCFNLELNTKKGKFSDCSRCQRRSYCSDKCFQVDWVLHRRECKAASSGTTQAPKAATMAPVNVRQVGPPESGEEVIVYGLKARPEFNGKLGVIAGDLVDGRYPVKLLTYGRQIAVKPDNFYRLGVFMMEKEGKGRKFKCSVHGSEVCSSCSLDFGAMNHLSKIQHDGLSSGEQLSRSTIEHIAESHFATVGREDPEGFSSLDKNIPMVCQGLSDPEKKFVLKSLLDAKKEQEDISLVVAAAIAAMGCYGARNVPVTIPDAVMQLECFVGKL